MSDILKTQRSFARKATAQPEHRFEDMYHLICRQDWLEMALKSVLSNTGARTPGIDGVAKQHLMTMEQQAAFIAALQADLKAGTYCPSPVKRKWIPKPGKTEKRGLGIPIIADRIVQEMLRMLLEPIWESDFLPCSHGFRPGHKTMDCIAPFWVHANRSQKYYWIIEGDIRKCFDRINHKILMKLVKRRVADHRILKLINQFLKAGILDDGLFRETREGTPQGGILSPLLANLYLNELDQWWWRNYRSLSLKEKRRNRSKGSGNAILVRYADDFCILWNGPREGAIALRDKLRDFLWEELHLELSVEKTQVTHVNDGINFLGFHIQRRTPADNTPWLRVTPTRENVSRFRAKIKARTRYNTTFMPVDDKFRQLNRLIQGWGNYYRHVSFSADAKELDWWINQRVLIWLECKHKGLGVRKVLDLYKMRQKEGKYDRWNFGTHTRDGAMVYIAKLTDIRLRHYRYKDLPNPYLNDDLKVPIPLLPTEDPFNDLGPLNYAPERTEWLEIRLAILERDGFRCVECGNPSPPYNIHHIVAQKDGGGNERENLVTLCHKCHIQTESYGRNKTG